VFVQTTFLLKNIYSVRKFFLPSSTKGVKNMGWGYSGGYGGGYGGSSFVLIVVLFILLIIVLSTF
jgi:uncharacterized protein (TIGR01732 family)